MGKLFTLALLVAIIAFILYAFGGSSRKEQEQQQPSPPREEQPISLKPTPAPAPGPARPASPTPNVQARLNQAAREAGVNVQILRQAGNEVTVRVSWTGDVATIGGDFIMTLMRKKIISNFDVIPEQNRFGRDNQGRGQWSQEFKLRVL